MFGPNLGRSLFVAVKNNLFELFEDYIIVYGQSVEASQFSMVGQSEFFSASTISFKPISLIKARFKKHKAETGYGGSKKSDLEIYLNEAVLEEDGDLDLLKWWKINSERFPLLSRMARDVLAVPISTVASESCFSTGGRVLDAFRSSLTLKIVEVLICTQDWLRLSSADIFVEEEINEIENFEKGKFVYICFVLFPLLYG